LFRSARYVGNSDMSISVVTLGTHTLPPLHTHGDAARVAHRSSPPLRPSPDDAVERVSARAGGRGTCLDVRSPVQRLRDDSVPGRTVNLPRSNQSSVPPRISWAMEK